MHSTERERLILTALRETGFVSYRDIEGCLDASPATIRRDLARLERIGAIMRVHGGARLPEEQQADVPSLTGTPFEQSITLNLKAKRAIAKAAAQLCSRGEGVVIDGGTTTLQMCPFLEGLDLQVLTNSLYIVQALLQQQGTQVMVPSGAVFREQNIILAPAGEESMPRFHAPKLFVGAAGVGRQGVTQADIIHVAAQRRFMDRAEEIILLVDSTKFRSPGGAIACPLDEISTLVTDPGIPDDMRAIVADAGVELMVVDID